jgi:cytochrome c2
MYFNKFQNGVESMKKGVAVTVALFMVLGVGVMAFSADVENGKKVYTAQKCQMCHSIAGAGNKKSPLDGVGSKLSTEDLKKWIVTPKAMKADTKMKAYPNLPEKDLADLVAYMESLKK